MRKEVLEKKLEFIHYMKNHMLLIRKAFDEYGKCLCDALDVDYNKLYEVIKVHDRSKLLSKTEFEAFRKKLFPASKEILSRDEYTHALKLHTEGNPHHVEHWHRHSNDMPDLFIAEMLLDWVVEQLYEGKDIMKFYEDNKVHKGFSQYECRRIERGLKSIMENNHKHESCCHCNGNCKGDCQCHNHKHEETSITPKHIAEILSKSKIVVKTIYDRITIVTCKLPNGYVLVESSGALSKENYSEDLGYKSCMTKIIDKLWMLEGYVLANKLHNKHD